MKRVTLVGIVGLVLGLLFGSSTLALLAVGFLVGAWYLYQMLPLVLARMGSVERMMLNEAEDRERHKLARGER